MGEHFPMDTAASLNRPCVTRQGDQKHPTYFLWPLIRLEIPFSLPLLGYMPRPQLFPASLSVIFSSGW